MTFVRYDVIKKTIPDEEEKYRDVSKSLREIDIICNELEMFVEEQYQLHESVGDPEKAFDLKLHLYRRETRQVSFYEFVHRGLVRYTNMEHERYTRSIMNGLTVGQRKIIFTCIKRSDKEEVTVAQLAGLVAARTSLCNYGEENLTRTIIGLAHDFVGTNNINLLQPIGHFGTRLQVHSFC